MSELPGALELVLIYSLLGNGYGFKYVYENRSF